MSKRFKICLSLWFAVLAVSICCGQTFAQESSAAITSGDESVELMAAPISAIPQSSEIGPPPPAPIAMVPDEEWSIQITPALKLRSDSVVAEVRHVEHQADGQHEAAGQPVLSGEQFASEYQRIYESIPFNRAEFNRNPTYRHDSAMEILTGNARHQTIVKHQPQQIVRPAARSRRLNPAQFGYLRPALRLNYYRYFPSLNPYLNGLNLSGAF